MMMSREFHIRHPEGTGVALPTLHRGYIADTPLLRNTPPLFQKIFPWFQKSITKGYVAQPRSGEHVARVVAGPGFAVSGVHWSCGNRQTEGREAFAQSPSGQAADPQRSRRLWDLRAGLVGLTENR
jgi:protochlorophyllide reductase